MFSFDNLRCQIKDHKQKEINEVCLQKNCQQLRTICHYCKKLHKDHEDKIIEIDHVEDLLKNFQPQDKTQQIKNEIANYIKDAKILLDTLQLDLFKQFEQFDNPINILNINQEPNNIEDLNRICNQIIPLITVENQKVKFQSNEGQINDIRQICVQELNKLLENIRQSKQNLSLQFQNKNQSSFRFQQIELQNIEYLGNIAKLKHKLVYSQLLFLEPELQEVKNNNIAEIKFKILQNDIFCSFGISTIEQLNLMKSSTSLTKSSIFTGNSRIQYMIKSDGKILSSDMKYNDKDIGFKIQKNDVLKIRLNYKEQIIEFGKNNDNYTQLRNIQIDDHLYGAIALKEIGDSVQLL